MKFALCLLVAIFSCQVLADDSVSEKWLKFQRDFGKSYKSPVEARTRFAIFEENLKKIEEHNIRYEKGEVSWTKGINQFADWKSEEFMQYVNKFKYNKNVKLPVAPSRLGEDWDIPESVDWRTEGAVSAVKNQGDCGSCWSFSGTGGLEGQLKLVRNQTLSLSEQNLIDCATWKRSSDYYSDGCRGGVLEDGFIYAQNEGIATEEDYPYEGKDGECRPKSKVYKTNGYLAIPPIEKYLQIYVGKIGPISVGIEATENLQLYKNGVLYDELCSGQLNHGVLAVGYGNEDGKDYWLIKNSWGADWGEDGYFKLARKDNNCGIADMAYYPIVSEE